MAGRRGLLEDPSSSFHHLFPIEIEAPKIAKLPYFSGFMVDITIVNRGYFMVYKPTNITGGPHPVSKLTVYGTVGPKRLTHGLPHLQSQIDGPWNYRPGNRLRLRWFIDPIYCWFIRPDGSQKMYRFNLPWFQKLVTGFQKKIGNVFQNLFKKCMISRIVYGFRFNE